MMYVLKNGYVLQVETGKFVLQDVYIEGHQIIKMDEQINVEGAEVIDCTGKYLIPGLIDMHVHIKNHFATYFTAAGVTTVRNTAGSVIELKSFMKAEADNPIPRVISADRMIDGPPGLWGETTPYNINIDNVEDAKCEVERQVNLGADFIKIYGWLKPDIMKAVIDEAKKYGKEVSCDILHSNDVDALDVAEMGMDWLEHASGIVQAMYPEWKMNSEKDVWEMIPWDAPDEEKITEVCKKLLEKNIKLCPTLVLYDQMQKAEAYWQVDDERIHHMMNHPSLFKHWEPMSQAKSGQSSFGIQTKMIQKIAYTYYKLGGVVVTGTDTPAGIFTYPGMALHRELQLFVEAGFTPLEALQQATINAAKALQQPFLGQVKEGFVADIVVLNENPLTNIGHTMAIHSVFKGGTPFTTEQLFSLIPSKQESEHYLQTLLEEFKNHGLRVEHLV
jgi:hypothetical protein